jgi:hypothetical protein
MLKNKQSILKLIVLTLPCLGIQNAFAQDAVNTSVKESGNGGIIVVSVIILVAVISYILLKHFGYIKTKELVNTQEILQATPPESEQDKLAGEVKAAIVMALYLYTNEIHDQEDPVITMIRVSRTYSPWSSKIYGLRKSPR